MKDPRVLKELGGLADTSSPDALGGISSGWPVSRILSSVGFPVYAPLRGFLPVLRACAIISLSSLPRTQMRRAASCPCLALLPAVVAWPPALLRTPVVSYITFSPSPSPRGPSPLGGGGRREGSLFLWPCSGRFPHFWGFPVPGFPRRRALWSADFPRLLAYARSRDRPASLKTKVSYRFLVCKSIRLEEVLAQSSRVPFYQS
jgi:hypothetical protein